MCTKQPVSLETETHLGCCQSIQMCICQKQTEQHTLFHLYTTCSPQGLSFLFLSACWQNVDSTVYTGLCCCKNMFLPLACAVPLELVQNIHTFSNRVLALVKKTILGSVSSIILKVFEENMKCEISALERRCQCKNNVSRTHCQNAESKRQQRNKKTHQQIQK